MLKSKRNTKLKYYDTENSSAIIIFSFLYYWKYSITNIPKDMRKQSNIRSDYELTCYELEEANSLCHGNWIEIERQYKYIQTLQKILSDNDIPHPNEYDFD